MDNQELYEMLKENYGDIHEAVIENIKQEIDDRIVTRLAGLKNHLEAIIDLLQIIVDRDSNG